MENFTVYLTQLATVYKKDHAYMVLFWLLEKLTKKPVASLMTQDIIILNKEEEQQLADWIKKITQEQYPLQYILETVPFGMLELSVEPPLLIPRPETEEWVATLIETLKAYKDEPLVILDMCCGSGAIGLWLAAAFKNAHIYLIDLSEQAVALTTKNAQQNNIQNITIVTSDLFTHIPKNIHYDLIVSNPPYITQGEWELLTPQVKKWEDKNALVAPDNGLYFYKELIKQIPNYLKKETCLKAMPRVVLEIGAHQGHTVSNLCKNAGLQNSIQKDLAGKDRTIWITD